MSPSLPRLVLLGVCALALSGCISLLPKTTPAQLYRFGPEPSASALGAPHVNSVGVFRTNGKFEQEAANDRILTVTGGKAAYIADSRWVAPAEVLFDQAIGQAFDSSSVRLVARGQQGQTKYALRLDVRNFESRYDSGPKAAPLIVVRVHAALTKSDLSSVGEQDFDVRVPASNNRVGDIVSAYNTAVAQVLEKIVAWTEAHAT